MFLKSLSMKGFKSFADPTVLEFEPGITVVVGPNGSGKSNVVDAVTWVLGAQGPRALRSQKMEDVIFMGTASRAALGRAEVSLTIDNSSGKLTVDLAEVTITRTLFRTGDSEYAINGTPCRLLDVQELLSDSGVGRTQHMIIGQNQLDTVLNARPEDRRAVIEEAAGVLKHRRRRERAERRLASTQENLERLGDLVREVRRQIRPLERQAAAARSHSTIADELRAVRLHLAGTELSELSERRRAAAAELETLGGESDELGQTLAELDAAAAVTTAELSSSREVDLASALGALQALVERARGTTGVLRERARALEAALDAAADVDVVSTLEAEGARLEAELEGTGEAAEDLEPDREALAAERARLDQEEAAFVSTWGDTGDVARAETALAEGRAQVDLARRALDHEQRAIAEAEERIGSLDARAAEVQAAAGALVATRTDHAAETARLAEALAAAADADDAAEAASREAEQHARSAEQRRHRTSARAEALARALSELEGAGGREALAGVAGVVGSLVDLVTIDAGWEQAFEAAAGASVSAVVVDGRAAAREALSALHRTGATGAILAPVSEGRAPETAPTLGGAEAVRPHVGARRGVDAPGLGAVLDALVGHAVRVSGWEAAVDLALERPDLVVVTAEGDRFADSGWRVQSSRGVVTAAAVDEARQEAEAAEAAANAAADRWADARREAEAARRAHADVARASDRHEAAEVALAADAARLDEERERVGLQLAEARRALALRAERRGEEETNLAEREAAVGDLQAAAAAVTERAASASQARRALEDRRAELAASARQLEVRTASLAERRRVLSERRAEVERRLEGHAEERQEAAARRRRLEAEGVTLGRLEGVVAAQHTRLERALEALRADYRHQVEAVRAGGERLEDLRQKRAAADARLATVRDRTRTLELEAAEVALRSEALTETVKRDLGADTDEAVAAPLPEIPAGTDAVRYAAQLADRLAALGPVNPLALEELSVLEERHQELDTQVADVRTARRELQEVVRVLDAEIMESFASAAADVNEHFSALVAMLFPGGTGRLTLTEPEDLLNTGVEVEVRPAGRNVRRVSLLSGGERALAALAFLFAVFRSRPSPFYLMDEVEAALDDVNLHRFLGLVREFRDEAQLIIVSHQKRTMENADALYGVTMAPGGSSQVVSQKVGPRPGAAVGP